MQRRSGRHEGTCTTAVHYLDLLAPQIVDHVSLGNVGAEQGIDLGRLKVTGSGI